MFRFGFNNSVNRKQKLISARLVSMKIREVIIVKTEVLEKIAALVVAAFGLVAALAWNDAIKALFVGRCGTEGAGALCTLSSGGPWVYAVIVTIIAVLVTVWVGKAAQKAKT